MTRCYHLIEVPRVILISFPLPFAQRSLRFDYQLTLGSSL